MKEFDYVIIGGGCAGLSLAYELDIHQKLNKKTLAIVEPRTEYKRDKTWSFWKVSSHNFEDCVRKSWNKFNIRTDGPRGTQANESTRYPYQSIDSGLFYKKINDKLKENRNIKFFKNIKELDVNNSFVFNSVPTLQAGSSNLWQHFYGFEIETDKDCFNDNTIALMDFCCDQRNNVHFFYILPFSKKKALIETTWISKNDNSSLKDYESQIKNYIKDQPFSKTSNGRRILPLSVLIKTSLFSVSCLILTSDLILPDLLLFLILCTNFCGLLCSPKISPFTWTLEPSAQPSGESSTPASFSNSFTSDSETSSETSIIWAAFFTKPQF